MADLNVTVTDFAPRFAQAIKTAAGHNAFAVTFPNTVAALNMLAHKYLIKWRNFTQGEQIPGAPRAIWSRGEYTKSISVDLSDDMVKRIYSTGPWTERIERGHGEIDLKPGLLRGPKSRLGDRGPYNIVAFRHGTTQAPTERNPMPINVYNLIKSQTDKADRAYKQGTSSKPGTSRVTGNVHLGGQRYQRSYRWGYRLPKDQGGPRKTKETSRGDYTWKTGKRTSMVRMDASTSSARSSSYITFRTVSVHSDPASWIVPPLEGIPIRQAVIDALEDETKKILQMAMEEDLSG